MLRFPCIMFFSLFTLHTLLFLISSVTRFSFLSPSDINPFSLTVGSLFLMVLALHFIYESCTTFSYASYISDTPYFFT